MGGGISTQPANVTNHVNCHLQQTTGILPLLLNRTVILELQEQGPGSILHYVD